MSSTKSWARVARVTLVAGTVAGTALLGASPSRASHWAPELPVAVEVCSWDLVGLPGFPSCEGQPTAKVTCSTSAAPNPLIATCDFTAELREPVSGLRIVQ